MDTRHLKAAVAVARHGSFTAAAERLFMAQSTVTRQVAALERELGVELFVRSGRSVDLTPPGQLFLEQVDRILDDLARAVAATRASGAAADDARLPVAEYSS